MSEQSVSARAVRNKPSTNMKVPEKISTRTTTTNLDRTLNTPPPLCPSAKFHVQEPLGIADHDLLIDCRIEIETIKRRARAEESARFPFKLVLGILIPLIVGVFVFFFTPVGDWIKAKYFPHSEPTQADTGKRKALPHR